MTLEEIRSKALEMAEPEFKKFEPIALANTKKVLEAFKECQVSDYHFTGTTGYGYNDVGREKLDEVFAYVFKGEKAIVRPHFVSGTHALATTLISLMVQKGLNLSMLLGLLTIRCNLLSVRLVKCVVLSWKRGLPILRYL